MWRRDNSSIVEATGAARFPTRDLAAFSFVEAVWGRSSTPPTSQVFPCRVRSIQHPPALPLLPLLYLTIG